MFTVARLSIFLIYEPKALQCTQRSLTDWQKHVSKKILQHAHDWGKSTSQSQDERRKESKNFQRENELEFAQHRGEKDFANIFLFYFSHKLP